MKKIILSAATMLALCVIGCKTGGGDPKSVLMSFIDALGKKDINTAKKYATKDSEAMLGMIQMSMSMIPDSAKNKIYDRNNMEFGEATITGDKATVPVKDKTTTARFPVAAKPSAIVIDPNVNLLAGFEVAESN